MAKYIYKKYNLKDEYSYSVGGRRANNYAYLLDVYPSFSFNSSIGKFTLSGTPRSVKELGSGYYSYPTSGVSEIERIGYIDTVYDDYGKKYYELWKEQYTVGSPKKVRGSYISEVVAENGTYPDNGISGGYWYVKGDLANTPPTISGQDQDLGDKNLGFVITYQVDDVDVGDNLIVTKKLNGSIIKTINGAPRNQLLEIEVTNEKLFSLPLNSTNTIEIKVDDQNGGIAYRRYTFRRTNTAPIISGQDEDLGQKIEPFSIDFSVYDNEGNAITVKTYLDGVQKEEYQATDGATNTFTITKDDWFKLPIGQHSIKIEAIDEHGATAVRNYTFSRHDDKIQFTLKTPIETDIMATKILVTPTWNIPQGATGKVEACNNGFDKVPTWEDITSQVLINRHYNFTNDIKTAEKWGINIRFTIKKGTATEQCIVNGFGGAFE